MKNQIRKAMLDQRESLNEAVVLQKSHAIHETLMQMTVWKEAMHMMTYLDFRNEVKTDSLIKNYLHQRKHVYIPVTNPKDYRLTVSELKNPEQDLQVTGFGLLEPKDEALRPTPPQKLDLVIVPGVAFDREGYRIGFGAGYYDRFLPLLQKNAVLISLVYDFQLIPHVPRESHDLSVDWIITESELIQC